MISRRRIGPLARRALAMIAALQAHIEAAAGRTVRIAHDPVFSFTPPLPQIMATDDFGTTRERACDVGCGGCHKHAPCRKMGSAARTDPDSCRWLFGRDRPGLLGLVLPLRFGGDGTFAVIRIGKGSCRGRGCQYVKDLVCGVTIKK